MDRTKIAAKVERILFQYGINHTHNDYLFLRDNAIAAREQFGLSWKRIEKMIEEVA